MQGGRPGQANWRASGIVKTDSHTPIFILPEWVVRVFRSDCLGLAQLSASITVREPGDDFVVELGDLDLPALLTTLEIEPHTDMLPGKGSFQG